MYKLIKKIIVEMIMLLLYLGNEDNVYKIIKVI